MSSDYLKKIAALIHTSYEVMDQAETTVFKEFHDLNYGSDADEDKQLKDTLDSMSPGSLSEAALHACLMQDVTAALDEEYDLHASFTEVERIELTNILRLHEDVL